MIIIKIWELPSRIKRFRGCILSHSICRILALTSTSTSINISLSCLFTWDPSGIKSMSILHHDVWYIVINVGKITMEKNYWLWKVLLLEHVLQIWDGYTHGGNEVLVLLHCWHESSTLAPTTSNVLLRLWCRHYGLWYVKNSFSNMFALMFAFGLRNMLGSRLGITLWWWLGYN